MIADRKSYHYSSEKIIKLFEKLIDEKIQELKSKLDKRQVEHDDWIHNRIKPDNEDFYDLDYYKKRLKF